MQKVKNIILNSLPILLMISFIPVVENDYLLCVLFIAIITISLLLKFEEKDILFLVFGFFIMIIFESLFIATGVETFERDSLFGIMPIWLPALWGYGFVAIKRSVTILIK